MAKKSMKDAVEEFAKEKQSETSKADTSMLNVRLPRPLIKTLKVWTVQNDTTIVEFVQDVLEKELRQRGAL